MMMTIKKVSKNLKATAMGVAVFLATMSAAQAQVSPVERQALIDFYESTNGPNWTNKTGWLGAAGTECSWYGVTCSGANISPRPQYYNVQALELSANNLQGQVLESLVNLTNLRTFSIANNQLSGDVPLRSGGGNLWLFNISNNQFSGVIPPLSLLTNLQVFDASNNRIIGNIPGLPELLWSFDVSGNQLTGNLPSLSELMTLSYFYANNNKLTGAIPLLPRNLWAFNVANNQISGNIPPILELNNLRHFFVCDNQLTGNLPSLSGLSNLESFCAFNNQLTGNIPNISGLSNLQNFSVYNNQLTGSIPPLSGLSNLKIFYAWMNKLTGEIPSLAGLSNLEHFSISRNELTGNIPSLAGLGNLQTFYVWQNKLTGNIPSLIGLNNLRYFSVARNQLTGGFPSLAGLNNLELFQITENQISGGLIEAPPPSLVVATPIDGSGHSVYLCQNQLISSGNAEIDAAWDRINYDISPQNVRQNVPWQNCQTLPPVNLPTPPVISANPSEGGTALCKAIGIDNLFECLATPSPGYKFSGFSGDCAGTTCSVSTAAGNKTVTANFEKMGFSIQTIATPSYGGTLVCTPNAVSYNGSANCVAQPNEGYEVSSYSGACASTTGTLCTINNVQSDQQAGVTFINRDQGVYLRFDGYCDVIRFDRVPGSEVFYGRNIPESCDGDALMFARIVQTNNDIFVTMVGGYVQDGSGQSSALKILDLKLDQTRTNLAGNFSAKAVMRGANEQATQVTGGLSGTWSLNTTKGSGTYAATAAYGSTAANQMRAKAVSKPSLFKQLAP